MRVKLLYVLSEFMYGSKVRQLCDLVSGLDHGKFDIEICALELGNEAAAEVAALGVPVFQLRLYPPRSFNKQRILQFLKSPIALWRGNYDIVHSLLYQSIFIEPLLVKGFGRAKYIYTKTNLEWSNHNVNWRLKSKLADKIVSISAATDSLLNAHGFDSKTEKIYLGIDTSLFSPNPSGAELRERLNVGPHVFVFGCAAQFVSSKRHDVLLDAFERLCEQYPDVALFLCGMDHNDEYVAYIKRRIETSKFRSRIYILGALRDMPEFYSALDCFVLPSENETFGYVYIEAMSCGLPVVACNAAGPLDIIDENVDGALIELGNVPGLVAAMEGYYLDQEKGKTHGRRGREKVIARFSTEEMIRRHEMLYANITGLA